MQELYQSISHSKWNCVYVLPYRFYTEMPSKNDVWENPPTPRYNVSALGRQDECRIIEGHLMPVRAYIRDQERNDGGGSF